MIPDLLDGMRFETLIAQDSLPQLCSAADRLRRIAQHSPEALGPDGLTLLDELLEAAAAAEQSIALQRARIRFLESLSVTDELTTLLNRRGFETELSRALARARRMDEKGLLLLCDLNHFKAVNDTYGHQAGDAMLRAVAKALKGSIRESDYVARVGGDEFAVIMTHTAGEESEFLARKLSTLINGLTVPWQASLLPVSASFGMATYDRRSQPETLIFLADQDLYRNKRPQLVASEDLG
ncbi:GGDEF domain-containing protein [Pelagibius sp.]|uniref:GGDEF domain-containing protein n=1 Tax=Pelagibius sp. TaxID=1931238 RepID=UPI00263518BA|nr:GGDEF domain-containing protein [Pelagibius sp.]